MDGMKDFLSIDGMSNFKLFIYSKVSILETKPIAKLLPVFFIIKQRFAPRTVNSWKLYKTLTLEEFPSISGSTFISWKASIYWYLVSPDVALKMISNL